MARKNEFFEMITFILTTIFIIFVIANISVQAAVIKNDPDDTVIIESNDIGKISGIRNRAGNEADVVEVGIADSGCDCVPYYLCNENMTVITDGHSIIDIRAKIETCSDALEVCCRRPLAPEEVTTKRPDTKDKEQKPIPPEVPIGCGKRNSYGIDLRIIGDVNNESQYGEFPWMMAIMVTEVVDQNNALNLYQCGGSLIHPQVVMTAAHCVKDISDKSQIIVRAGEWDTQTQNERYQHVNSKVSRVIIHEQFYSGGMFNDIALLVTTEPFTLSDYINTVCLPEQDSVEDRAICTATGWGKNEFGKQGVYQVILKKLDLPMVQHDECQRILRTTRVGRFFKLHDSFVCAGGEPGRDTCSGDGGGPLICPIHGSSLAPGTPRSSLRYKQTGIVSWGIGCGSDIPGVYVNVAKFRNWIDGWMRNLNFDTKYYTDDSIRSAI